MGAISNMTVISNDGAGQVSRNVSAGVHETAQLLKDTTGFDVIQMLKGFGQPAAAPTAGAPAAATTSVRSAGNGKSPDPATPQGPGQD
jgi:flotillin